MIFKCDCVYSINKHVKHVSCEVIAELSSQVPDLKDIMAEANDGEPYVGKIEARDGVIKMFSKPRGLDDGIWVEITNFSIEVRHHSANKIENEGMIYVFQCRVVNGEQFVVPFNVADLDSNHDIYQILKARKRPFGGSLNYEKIGKGGTKAQLNSYLKTLVKTYQNSGDNRMPAIVVKKTGFVTVEMDEQSLVAYVLGPDCVLPCKPADAAAIRLLRKVWIGNPQVENFTSSANFGLNPQKFLDAIQEYHGVNASSPIAAIAYSWLTLHMRDLAANGLKIGALHINGPMGSGKSSLRANFEAIFPKVKTHAGEIKKVEQTLTVHMLKKKICEPRWLLIQDPPTNDPEKMNEFCDCFYEGKVEMTSASRHSSGDQPSMGLMFIWQHEKADLEKMSRTCGSKGVYILHQRNFDKDFAKLEEAWCKESVNAPAIFLSLLNPINMEKLKKTVEELIPEYHKELSERYSAEFLNECHRLLQQYALINAAAIQWRDITGYNVNDVGTFFRKVCLPHILDILERKREGHSKELTSTPEEQLICHLANLSNHEFLENVGIYQEKRIPTFGFSLPLIRKSKNLETFINSICTGKEIKAVLHEESDLLWFKRTSAKGYNGHFYGKSNRKTVCMCPVTRIPKSIQETLKARLEAIIPNMKDLDLTKNVEAEINDAFNKIYHPIISGKLTCKAKLMQTLDNVTEEEAENIQQYAEKLIGKRKHGQPQDSSSNEDSDEEVVTRKKKHTTTLSSGDESGQEETMKAFEEICGSGAESNDDPTDEQSSPQISSPKRPDEVRIPEPEVAASSSQPEAGRSMNSGRSLRLKSKNKQAQK